MSGFAVEVERAKQEGVSLPENLPFLFTPESPNGKALLLVHGFGASPYEMCDLGRFLQKRGYLVMGVRLAGHGTNPKDLRRCRWQDWLNAIDRGYLILQKFGYPISLIAQSTGALLGLYLSQQRQFDRAVLLSPFIRLRHPLANFAGIIKFLMPFQTRSLPHPENLHYYERRPLAGIEQIGLLRNQIIKKLPEIKVPTQVLAAEGDQTVASGTGKALFEKLGSPYKRFHLFGPEVPHVLSTPENPEFNATCRLIEEFLSKDDLSDLKPGQGAVS